MPDINGKWEVEDFTSNDDDTVYRTNRAVFTGEEVRKMLLGEDLPKTLDDERRIFEYCREHVIGEKAEDIVAHLGDYVRIRDYCREHGFCGKNGLTANFEDAIKALEKYRELGEEEDRLATGKSEAETKVCKLEKELKRLDILRKELSTLKGELPERLKRILE